jgi:hypothetical protein
MIYLLSDGQVVGLASNAIGLPIGFTAFDSPLELDPQHVYWDGKNIIEKPPTPGPEYFWGAGEWIAPPIGALALPTGWAGLFSGLSNTPMWQRVFAAAGRTLRANAAFTLLLNTLTASHDIGTLAFAIDELREAMRGISAIGDFPPEETDQINQILEKTGFDLRLK